MMVGELSLHKFINEINICKSRVCLYLDLYGMIDSLISFSLCFSFSESQ